MTRPTPTGLYCYICRDQEVSTVATRLCNERRKPVCPKHAAGCYEDGHGTSELEPPMIEKLTDAEVLCAWMEPKPPLPDCYSHLQLSPRGWWTLGPVMHGGMEWYPRRNGGPVGLDALWEVEERLQVEARNPDDPEPCIRRNRYVDLLAERTDGLWHADAPTRIKALAAILRPIVEGGAL